MTWIITIVALVVVLCGFFSFWMYTRHRVWVGGRTTDNAKALNRSRRLGGTLEEHEVGGTSVMLGLNQSPPPAYEEFHEVKYY